MTGPLGETHLPRPIGDRRLEELPLHSATNCDAGRATPTGPEMTQLAVGRTSTIENRRDGETCTSRRNGGFSTCSPASSLVPSQPWRRSVGCSERPREAEQAGTSSAIGQAARPRRRGRVAARLINSTKACCVKRMHIRLCAGAVRTRGRHLARSWSRLRRSGVHRGRAPPRRPNLPGQVSSHRCTAVRTKASSVGSPAGLPARWPQMLGIGSSSADFRWGSSAALSATRK
jgi:hypothetical protein